MPALKNTRQERYAQELAKGVSQREAYILAGYRENKGGASRLAEQPDVRTRLAELQERGAIRAEITIATITEMLLEDRKLARELGQAAPAVSATEKLGKLHGHFVERTENVNTTYVVSSDPVDDIEDWVAQHAPN